LGCKPIRMAIWVIVGNRLPYKRVGRACVAKWVQCWHRVDRVLAQSGHGVGTEWAWCCHRVGMVLAQSGQGVGTEWAWCWPRGSASAWAGIVGL
jgi:hypothetical protein